MPPEKSRLIRTSAKAVISHNGHLLTVVKQYPGGTAYILPGGRQGYGEPLDRALRRECEEEIGAPIEIEKLLF